MQDSNNPEVPQDSVGQILTRKGHKDVAVISLGEEISKILRKSWPKTGPCRSDNAVSSVWLEPFLGALGVGSTAASWLASGKVFLATADPKTLITIGKGVGSAVIGQGGKIVGHAPFVAAGSILKSVLGPVMLFMTVSSIITNVRLRQIEKKLGKISATLERVRQLMEADDYAKFESAVKQLDEVDRQFEHSQRFTDGMKEGLSWAQRDVTNLRNKFQILVYAGEISEETAERAVSDIELFMFSSLATLQADTLRLYLTLQDDPSYVEHCQANLRKKIEECASAFRNLLNHDPLKAYRQQLQQELDKLTLKLTEEEQQQGMSLLQIALLPVIVPGGLIYEGLIYPKCQHLKKNIQAVDTILDTKLKSVRKHIRSHVKKLEEFAEPTHEETVVIYQDDKGTLKAYHTRDLRLEPVDASKSGGMNASSMKRLNNRQTLWVNS